MCLGSSLKGKCVLTKQSQFVDAVKSVMHKKFLNEPTNELENFYGFKSRRVENCFTCSIHRITVLLRFEGTSGDCLVQPTCSSRLSKSKLLRAVCCQVLNISKDGDSTTSLGN